MICVIDIVAGPAKGKRIWIRNNESLQIGRHSSVDLSIPSDPHLSRRHLLIEGTNGLFRARDLGSANGTFVNRAEVSSIELLDGDQIQVGTTMLSVALQADGSNPHARDGIVFGEQTRTTPAEFKPNVSDESTKRFLFSEQVQQEIDQNPSVEKTGSGTHQP